MHCGCIIVLAMQGGSCYYWCMANAVATNTLVNTISSITEGLLCGTMVASDYNGNHVDAGAIISLIMDSDECTFDTDEDGDALVMEIDCEEMFRLGSSLSQLQREATCAIERFWDC